MKYFVVAFLVSIFSTFAFAQEQKTVNVGIYETDPFAIKNADGTWSGFDVELWKLIADDCGFKTNFVEAQSFPALLDSVKNKQVDAALSSITITNSRRKSMEFSTPYFNSGLMIMVRENEKESAWSSFTNFFTNDIPYAISATWIHCVVSFVFLFVSLVIVFFHDKFFKKVKKTIPMTEYKLTFVDDVAMYSLIIVNIFLFAMFVAKLSSSMTANQFLYQLSMPKDLRAKSVATVADTTSVPVLNSYGANVVTVTDINDAYAMLIAGQVDAVVYDAPTLQYFAKNEGAGKVVAVGSLFAQQPYGVAMPLDSSLRTAIDASILKLKENGLYDVLYQRYFGID